MKYKGSKYSGALCTVYYLPSRGKSIIFSELQFLLLKTWTKLSVLLTLSSHCESLKRYCLSNALNCTYVV